MTAVQKTSRRGALAAALLAASLLAGLPAAAQPSGRPWMDPQLSPEQRAELALKEMTRDEKLTLVVGYFASPWPNFTVDPKARMGSAGYVPGIERLGIPPQWQTDAGVGVAGDQRVVTTDRCPAPGERGGNGSEAPRCLRIECEDLD